MSVVVFPLLGDSVFRNIILFGCAANPDGLDFKFDSQLNSQGSNSW